MAALAQVHRARVELELVRSMARYASDPFGVKVALVADIAMAARAGSERGLVRRRVLFAGRVGIVATHTRPFARRSAMIVRQLGVAALARRGSVGASIVRAVAARAFGMGGHRASREGRSIIVAGLARHGTFAAEVVRLMTIDAAFVAARK
jgi:hypothetical protein